MEPDIAIVGKTAEPHPKLEGTIHTAAEEILKAGQARCFLFRETFVMKTVLIKL